MGLEKRLLRMYLFIEEWYHTHTHIHTHTHTHIYIYIYSCWLIKLYVYFTSCTPGWMICFKRLQFLRTDCKQSRYSGLLPPTLLPWVITIFSHAFPTECQTLICAMHADIRSLRLVSLWFEFFYIWAKHY